MSYLICFWDKSRIQVEDSVGEKLQGAMQENSIKNFKLGMNLYAVSGVEKIITKEKAFEVFPADWEQLQHMTNESPSTETLQALESPKLPTVNPQGLEKLNIIKNNAIKKLHNSDSR